jgi:RNA polymerase sigma-70 factor, ECF subfamily
MAALTPGEITILLQQARHDRDAEGRLMELVYPLLRQLAAKALSGDRVGHVIRPSDLLNDAYLRLFRQSDYSWNDRRHFFAWASHVMRQIVTDQARRHYKEGRRAVSLDEALDLKIDLTQDWADVDLMLKQLEKAQPKMVGVVELRVFGGLTIEEAAEALAVSPATVKRRWETARALLRARLAGH